MTKINRRKFLSIFGLVSVGGIVKSQNDAEALEISVNRFSNDKKVNLQNIQTVAIRIKNLRITSNNIDYNKNAELSIYANVEGEDIGQVKSETINLEGSDKTLDNEIIKIDKPELFSRERYDPNKTNLDIYLTFKLDHPSINKTITKETKYTLDIGQPGSIISHSFSKYNNFETPSDNIINNTKVISGTNLSVLTNQTGFDKIKSLIGGGMTKNKSTYDIPSGIIDIKGLEFQYGTPRDYRDIKNTKEAMAESIKGSDLSVLTSQTGFDKIKSLIGGGMTKNKSTYDIPSGTIDIKGLEFQYGTPRDYRDIKNTKEAMAESINGSDLSVLTSQTGFDKIKSLIGGGMTKNKSTYDIPSGTIDIKGLEFQYSTPRDYRDIKNIKPDNNVYNLK